MGRGGGIKEVNTLYLDSIHTVCIHTVECHFTL